MYGLTGHGIVFYGAISRAWHCAVQCVCTYDIHYKIEKCVLSIFN